MVMCVSRPKTPRRWPPLWRSSAFGLLAPSALLLVMTLAWLGLRVQSVRHHLEAVRREAVQLQAQLINGERSDLAPLQRLQTEANAAHVAAHDTVWSALAHLPLLGRSLRTVRGLADVMHELSAVALPDLVHSADQVNGVRHASLSDGLPLSPLEAVSPRMQRAAAGVAAAQQQVRDLPGSLLMPGVGSARGAALRQLGKLQSAVLPVADAAAIAPDTLGLHHPRHFFVAFVNPAEARAGGGAGLFGAYAVVSARSGRMHVDIVGSNADLPNLGESPPGLPQEFVDRYGDLGADTSWAATNLSPHFPYDGAAWAGMYEQLSGQPMDGVAALDPPALAVLLKGQQPLDLPGLGRVDAGNVVSFLEKDQYRLPISTSQRKDVLKVVAKAAADRILGQRRSLTAVFPDLYRMTVDGHLRAMSTHPEVQARLERYPVAGALPLTSRPFAAAYVTNGSSGKLEAYLGSHLDYQVRSCAGSTRRVTVTVTLSNHAPSSGLPAYVTARADHPDFPTVLGQVRDVLSVYLTQGARVAAAKVDGRPVPVLSGQDYGVADNGPLGLAQERGHPVIDAELELRPAQQRVLTLDIDEPRSDDAPLLEHQPLPIPATTVVSGRPNCS